MLLDEFSSCLPDAAADWATRPFALPPQLWHAYLSERLEAVRGLAPNHPSVEALNNCFERAMVSMHKMPRIWIM